MLSLMIAVKDYFKVICVSKLGKLIKTVERTKVKLNFGDLNIHVYKKTL